MRNILVLIAVIAAGGAYWWSQSAPITQGGHIMGTDEADGLALANVVVPELKGDALIGEKVFNAKCAVCHGENAAGQDGLAPPLVHMFYVPNHHSDAAFLTAARNGVGEHHWTFGDMPPVAGMTDAEVKLVVAYIRTLQRANGIK